MEKRELFNKKKEASTGPDMSKMSTADKFKARAVAHFAAAAADDGGDASGDLPPPPPVRVPAPSPVFHHNPQTRVDTHTCKQP